MVLLLSAISVHKQEPSFRKEEHGISGRACCSVIIINGEINNEVANSTIAQLLYLDSKNNDDISIYINSPGGSVTDGMAIYDTMNFVKSDVSTIGVGMCASMGAFLLSSGKKGKRFC